MLLKFCYGTSKTSKDKMENLHKRDMSEKGNSLLYTLLLLEQGIQNCTPEEIPGDVAAHIN